MGRLWRNGGLTGSVLLVLLSLGAGATSATTAPAGPTAPTANTSIYLPLIGRNPLETLSISAPLGQIITVSLSLSESAHLYEAWDVDPPAPLAAHPLRALWPSAPDGPLTTALREQLAAHGHADILVYLAEQADLSAAASLRDWEARGTAVMQTLQNTATRSQAPLMEELRARGLAPQSFWIVNAILVHGDSALAEWLARRAEVAVLAPNALHAVEVSPATPAAVADIAWGVEKIGAPRVWSDWGVTGAGVVVANIDTGVAHTHTALFNNYRGNTGENLINDYNWYDPAITPTVAPDDKNGHGTHTLGTIAGAEGIGVAPGAQWIAARGCASNFCSDADLLASAQWILAPTDLSGQNPRPDLRPHIVSNSWGELGDNNWYSTSVQAWNAAGIFSAFANGNSGSLWGCGSTISPGNYAESLAVGATDANDFIADFSSRGPTSDGRIKPEISAPGVNVPSASHNGGLISFSGTSMATPHVAGAVALLWSANPLLIGDLVTTQYLLTSTAQSLYSTECGDAANALPNNVYGWGRLDAWKAVQAARVEVPWLSLPFSGTAPSATLTLDARQVAGPGQYPARVLIQNGNAVRAVRVVFTVTPADTAQWTGTLDDRWGGPPLVGRVQLADGPAAFTDANGAFTLTLPLGAYTATASSYGFISETAPLSLTASIYQPITLTLDAPHLAVSAPPLSATLPFGGQQLAYVAIANHGSQTLTVSSSVPALEWSTDELISPTLYDLSAFAPLSLTDDLVYTNTLALGFSIPIFGVLTDHVYLSSNGWVSTYKTNSSAPLANCLPSTSLPRGTLAPFWADLDPSQGGAVRAGAVTSDTYVIGFEEVPHWQEKPDGSAPRFTFQLALHSDGRVEYLYGTMNALPGRWGVGASWDAGRGQSLACYRAPQTLAGRGWSLLNQPAPSVWLNANPINLTVPPGSNAPLTVTLSGLGYVPWRSAPFEAAVRLTTNDPREPVRDLWAQMLTDAPPFNLWLPLVFR